MKAIIVAMDVEAELLISVSKLKKTTDLGYSKIYELEYDETPYLLCVCGIGKVFAAIGTNNLINKYGDKIESVLNIGCAGSLDKEKAPILGTVIADKVAQHDMDTSAIGDPVGEIPTIHKIFLETNKENNDLLIKACEIVKEKYSLGVISSGDKFYADKYHKDKIKSYFGSLATDMEAGSIAQVCYVSNIPFSVVRVISDGEDAENEYEINKKTASDIAAKITLEYIKM